MLIEMRLISISMILIIYIFHQIEKYLILIRTFFQIKSVSLIMIFNLIQFYLMTLNK